MSDRLDDAIRVNLRELMEFAPEAPPFPDPELVAEPPIRRRLRLRLRRVVEPVTATGDRVAMAPGTRPRTFWPKVAATTVAVVALTAVGVALIRGSEDAAETVASPATTMTRDATPTVTPGTTPSSTAPPALPTTASATAPPTAPPEAQPLDEAILAMGGTDYESNRDYWTSVSVVAYEAGFAYDATSTDQALVFTRRLNALGLLYESIEEMTENADLVVVGQVVEDAPPLEVCVPAEPESCVPFARTRVEVLHVLAGIDEPEPGEHIAVALLPPEHQLATDAAILFLDKRQNGPADAQRDGTADASDETYLLVGIQGILINSPQTIRNPVTDQADPPDPVAEQVRGLFVEEVFELITMAGSVSGS